jgi:alkanesulfonate monooxygenase SsuD/methylene tetrahydromethanopterin reductase-like flavin-dependent oxidoreductase (luciferase family)
VTADVTRKSEETRGHSRAPEQLREFFRGRSPRHGRSEIREDDVEVGYLCKHFISWRPDAWRSRRTRHVDVEHRPIEAPHDQRMDERIRTGLFGGTDEKDSDLLPHR